MLIRYPSVVGPRSSGLLATLLSDSPMGLWLSPGSGTSWTDYSGYGRTGTVQNTTDYAYPATIGDVTLTGLGFAGHAGARVNCGVHADINNLDSFSLEAWVRINTTTTATQDMVAVYDGTNPLGMTMRGGPSGGQMRRIAFADNTRQLTGAGLWSPPLNQYVHYAVTYNAGTGLMTYYQAGTAVETAAFPAGRIKRAGGVFSLGNFPNGNRRLYGYLAVAAIYPSALTAAQVNKHCCLSG